MQSDQNKSTTIRSESDYAEATSAGMAAPERQQSYYEAIRNVKPPTDGINITSCASTAQLVDEITCPKEFYQVRNHHHQQLHIPNHRVHPPPIVEEEQESVRESLKNSKIISRGAYLLLVAICLVSVCLAIFCSVMTINMQKQVNDMEKKIGQRGPTSFAQGQGQTTPMCLPYDDIKQGPFDDDNKALDSLDIEIVNGTKICCARSPEQVSILFDLYASQFAKRKFSGKCTNGSDKTCNTTSEVPPNPLPPKPKNAIAAHLQIGSQRHADPDQDIAQPIRNWLSDRSNTYLEGVEVRNDRIVVPETGLYFVYSQVGFLIYYDSNKPVSGHEQSIFHYVMRYNPRLSNGGNQELMRSDLSQCWEQSKTYSRYTSYVGSAMRLQQNDELYVNVSQFASLQKQPSLTFFGMFKLD